MLAFLAICLVCLAKRKKRPVMVPAAAAACIEEQEEIHEVVTTGPCGEETVAIDIEDDVQIHEVVGGVAPGGSGGGAAGAWGPASCEPGAAAKPPC